MNKKTMCEIILYDKSGNCIVIVSFNPSNLAQEIATSLNKRVSVLPDGSIEVILSSSKEILDFLKKNGFTFDHEIVISNGYKLLYEC